MRNLGIIASQAFSPNKIADLKSDLDASDVSTIIDSGGVVSEWIYKDGNSVVTQFTGSRQPMTGVNTLNGKNVITFDGDDDYMELDSFDASANMTVFIVCKVISTDNRFRSVFTLDANNDFQIESGIDGQFRANFRSTGLGIPSAPIHSSDLIGIPSIINYRLSNNDLNVVLRVNGVQSDDTDSYNVGLDPVQTLYLGRNRNGNYPLEVDIGQLIIYHRDLTLSEMVAVETFLSNKWGIALL